MPVALADETAHAAGHRDGRSGPPGCCATPTGPRRSSCCPTTTAAFPRANSAPGASRRPMDSTPGSGRRSPPARTRWRARSPTKRACARCSTRTAPATSRRPSEIAELMRRTDPTHLGLCLDTGHLVYGGADPLAGPRRARSRGSGTCTSRTAIRTSRRSAREQGLGYLAAVRSQLFCELGRGSVDFRAVAGALEKMRYDGWIVVEQDVFPGYGTPAESARTEPAVPARDLGCELSVPSCQLPVQSDLSADFGQRRFELATDNWKLTGCQLLPPPVCMMAAQMTSETGSATGTQWKSPLHQMTQTTPTCLWNDSAALDELQFAIEHGAVGATCNPVIAHAVLKARIDQWRPRIEALVREKPTATEDDIAWAAVERLSADAAALLGPAFAAAQRHATAGCRFRPIRGSTATRRRSSGKRERFDRIAPNIIVKIPATSAGLAAIEAATAEGISINATVCFTLSQCVAVAEAVERGLERREAVGHDIVDDGPGVHDHGRPSRRLAEGGDGAGRHHHRPGPPRMGRRRGVQEDLPPVPEPRLSRAAARRPPSAITCTGASSSAAMWSSRRPSVVAEALRRQRHRGGVAHRHAGRARRRGRSAPAVRGFPPRLRRDGADRSTSSTASRPPGARCGSFSAPATTCARSFAASCCRIRMGRKIERPAVNVTESVHRAFELQLTTGN